MVQIMGDRALSLEEILSFDELKLDWLKSESRNKVVSIGIKKEIEHIEKKIKELKIYLAVNR